MIPRGRPSGGLALKPKSGKKIKSVDPAAPSKAEDALEDKEGEIAESKARERAIEAGDSGSEKVKKYVPPEDEETELTWIEVELQDRNGDPVPGARFLITTPDEQKIRGTLDKDGLARVENVTPGTCKITFPEYDQDAWETA